MTLAGLTGVDREMFALMWSPTVAAVSVVLDHAEDESAVRLALDGLQCAARLAQYHRLDQVPPCSLDGRRALLSESLPSLRACSSPLPCRDHIIVLHWVRHSKLLLLHCHLASHTVADEELAFGFSRNWLLQHMIMNPVGHLRTVKVAGLPVWQVAALSHNLAMMQCQDVLYMHRHPRAGMLRR